MWRKLSRGGVTLTGLALSVAGGGGMFQGWETIQLERGWSLFIGGAALLAGGAIVIALGQIIARLDALLAQRIESADGASKAEATEAPPQTPEQAPPLDAVEVDRYQAGDVTYVMFSDGAVEVRGPVGSPQRYASLAELRAHADRGQ
jgi:hypothetical protein